MAGAGILSRARRKLLIVDDIKNCSTIETCAAKHNIPVETLQQWRQGCHLLGLLNESTIKQKMPFFKFNGFTSLRSNQHLRNRYSIAEKRSIIADIENCSSLSACARKHQINRRLLHRWKTNLFKYFSVPDSMQDNRECNQVTSPENSNIIETADGLSQHHRLMQNAAIDEICEVKIETIDDPVVTNHLDEFTGGSLDDSTLTPENISSADHETSTTSASRTRYSVEQKLSIINDIKNCANITACARKHNINRQLLQRWKANFSNLIKASATPETLSKRRLCAESHGKYPEIEDCLEDWILKRQQNG